MSLNIQIEPVQILNKTGITVNAYVIMYDGVNCRLYWWLTDSDGNKLIDGNYDVPDTIISNWGIDDSIILNSLVTDNNFQIIN